MTFNLKSKIAALALSTMAMASQAGLMGQNVTLNFYFPDVSSQFCSNGSATVSNAVEFPNDCFGSARLGVDVGDSSLSVTFDNTGFASAAFNGIELDAASDITSVTFDGGDLTPFDFYLQDGNLWINFQSARGGRIANFSFSTDPQSVPEPSTLLLLGVGLLAAGRIRRR